MFISHTFKASAARRIAAHRSFINAHRRTLIICLAGFVLAVSCGAVWVRNEASRRLARERELEARHNYIPFEKSARPNMARREIEFWQSTENTCALVHFRDSYFAATDGGLVEFSENGARLRHYTVLDGLTESDLTSLCAYGSKLFIGTRSRGLLSFDGDAFESYRWTDRDAQAITAMIVSDGRLLISTFAGGLIEFDGHAFQEITAGTNHQRLNAINLLAREGAHLYAGTFNDGLWMMDAGRWLHFKAADGFPSERVVGVEEAGENLFVATDFGLAAARIEALNESTQTGQKTFRTLATLPTLSSLTKHGNLLLFSKDDGEIFSISADAASNSATPVRNLSWNRPAEISESRLITLNEQLWMLTSRGLWQAREKDELPLRAASAQIAFNLFGSSNENAQPSSNIINALALDADGKLWAGNFRRGIDIFDHEGKRQAHLESDAAREINFLLPLGQKNQLLAATSQGILRFDNKQGAINLTKTDGLLSNSVMHLARYDQSANGREPQGSTLALATARGLSINQGGAWRRLTTVQGLPSDNVYCAAQFGRSLFVGTLGGLAQIESGRVVRTFKDSNSKLMHNWITALTVADSRLFIGTYGGGVFELTPSGELRSFAKETGRMVVNPNAMWTDGRRIYVGTLDGAWVFNLSTEEWRQLKDELPSKTVLSITGDDKHIYLGTTGGIARIEKSYFDELERER